MNKNKIIIAVILAISITIIGVTAYAESSVKSEKIIDRAGRSGTVYTFTHEGNRCYVIEDKSINDSHVISCVKSENGDKNRE